MNKEKMIRIAGTLSIGASSTFFACGEESSPSDVAPLTPEATEETSSVLQNEAYLRELDRLTEVNSQSLEGLIAPTSIHNASSMEIDLESTKNTYSFLEEISQEPISFLSFTNSEGESWIGGFALRDYLKQRDMYLIDESLPRPPWSNSSNLESAPGASGIHGDEIASFVDIEKSNSLELANKTENVNAVFLTEACQSTIEAFAYNPNTDKYENDQTVNLRLQEIFCNGLSTAMISKTKKFDYQEYLEFANSQRLNVPSLGLRNESLITIPEEVYNSMPQNIGLVK